MKRPVLLLLASICILSACRNDSTLEVKPDTKPNSPSVLPPGQAKKKPDPGPPVDKTAVYDTIPDKAGVRLRLAKDSTNYDETVFLFNHTAGFEYDPAGDAPYLAGFGQESLASLSSDGRELVINTIPYRPGVPVKLDVGATSDGSYALQISYLNNIPTDIQVFIKDRYLNDSTDVRTGAYKFNIVKSDTSTYGANRFSVVFRNKIH